MILALAFGAALASDMAVTRPPDAASRLAPSPTLTAPAGGDAYDRGTFFYQHGAIVVAEHIYLSIVAHGPEDPAFASALEHLVYIADATGDTTDLEAIVGAVAVEDVPAPVWDRLAWVRARALFEAGDLDGALAWVRAIPDGTEEAVRARFLEAVVQARGQGLVSGRRTPYNPLHFAMISFMISLVPPPIVMSRASRKARAASYSSM